MTMTHSMLPALAWPLAAGILVGGGRGYCSCPTPSPLPHQVIPADSKLACYSSPSLDFTLVLSSLKTGITVTYPQGTLSILGTQQILKE